MTEETVTISKKEYQRLLRSDAKLEYLEAFGVDNWNGYSDAMQDLRRAEREGEITYD